MRLKKVKKMRKFIRILNGAVALAVAVIFSFVIYGNAAYPDTFYVKNSSDTVIDHIYYLSYDDEKSVDYQSAQSVGGQNSDLTLLGVIPVKSETVRAADEDTVLVSGDSFGIKLYTDGVMIVGTKDVSVNGKTVNPSKEAGISVGDIIVSINGEKVYSSDRVSEILNDNNGEAFQIKINRNGEYRDFSLVPVYVESEGCYKAGMWVRDSTAGIGTITFYNPENSTFAALGHPINDVDTNEIMPLLEGEAVEASVTKVYKGTPEQTGSLSCSFGTRTIGTLTKNTLSGVYGTYNGSAKIDDSRYYEVASAQEVEKGFAQVLTTVDGGGPQLYSIEITKINYNDTKEQKSMVIRVTDQELIEKTGGIVQGMSGSPIIQNGRLVGAVTHVVVNDPEKGYAIFAQNMLAESKT